jgi:hypothetical protein
MTMGVGFESILLFSRLILGYTQPSEQWVVDRGWGLSMWVKWLMHKAKNHSPTFSAKLRMCRDIRPSHNMPTEHSA